MKLLFITLSFSILVACPLFAHQGGDCKTTSATIKGTYTGKNLYFRNDTENGIKEVFLNNKKLASDLKAAAFEVELTGLKTGEPFELTIVYCDNVPLPYKLLNPDVIK